jgi:2-polyprenyl-3-methyl-5-hydroxy-6-metoxy-1,4-benzoquinol methylase
MALEYDAIDDPWYTHLFAELHKVLLGAVAKIDRSSSPRALDVGCGTGLQTEILVDAGFHVDAFDLSSGLLEQAERKRLAPTTWDGPSAFDMSMRQSHQTANRIRGSRPMGSAHYRRSDASDPKSYAGGPYDLIVCFGSVLSFVPDPDLVLHHIRSALSPKGIALVECEMKANLDLAWPLVDNLLFGVLGYEQPIRTSLSNLAGAFGGDATTVYPFALRDGGELRLPMRLFSHRGMRQRLAEAGLKVTQSRAIHAITNLMPSTFLHHSIGPAASLLFRALALADRALATTWPVRRLGCSLAMELTSEGSTGPS